MIKFIICAAQELHFRVIRHFYTTIAVGITSIPSTDILWWLIFGGLTVLFAAAAIYFFSKYAYYRAVVKYEGVLTPWPIKSVSLETFDSIFETNEFGPTLVTQIQFLGRGHLNVPGGTSDAETWILSVLAKKAKRIFEFGTCTGKTAYLMALNAPPDAQVVTLTLPPDQVDDYTAAPEDSTQAAADAKNESIFNKFVYTNTAIQDKIQQLYADSKQLDEKPYQKAMDLIFVDGSHAYSYVMSDSYKALSMVRPGGIVLWHDYRGPNMTKDVYKALNKLSKEVHLVRIKGTSLVAYRAS